MATLRLLARFSGSTVFLRRPPCPAVSAVASNVSQHRWSSYKSSPIYETPEKYTDYEVTQDPNEWKYVEYVLPYKVIPKAPTENLELPSQWKPPHASPKDYPYFIERTKNYMQPVYLDISYRGMRKITEVCKIRGDIWALQRDLNSYLVEQTGKRNIGCQINEFLGKLKFKGDHVSAVKRWMDTKGF